MEDKKNRGGRPKSDNPRTEVIPCKATKEEKKQIQEQAQKVGLSTSEYLRNLGMNYPITSIVDELSYTLLAKAHGDLGRLGGLFKYWQTKQEYPINMGKRSFRDIDELVDEIERKQKEILELSRNLLDKI